MFYKLLTQPLANGLILFYKYFGENLGLAIILFSIFLRLVLDPLTRPYMSSMKKMKEFAPQLEKLKQKYGKDKVKLAQAQSDFYKEKKINPTAGCLPYILQIVILISFFNVFTRTLSAGDGVTAKFNEILYPALLIEEGATINTKFLYLDITKPDTFRVDGIPFPIPGPILILAALVQFLSSKAMTPALKDQKKKAKKTKGVADDMQTSMQQSMIYTFPLLTIFFGVSFPSGLALYWLMFSVYQFVQQYVTSGPGGLTPLLKSLGVIKSQHNNEKGRTK